MLSSTTIARGNSSGVSITVADAFKTESSFRSLWEKQTPMNLPPPDQPNIDFDTEMVIAVFRGEKNTGGYDISIKSIEENDSEIIVRVEMSDPIDEMLVTRALTQPYHIVTVKKSNKPIRYKIEKVYRPSPFPTFILGFEDGVDVRAQVEQIENIKGVKSVQYLQGADMILVYFDPEQITSEEAYELLLVLNDSEVIQADPPFVDEDNYDNDNNDDNIFDKDNTWPPHYVDPTLCGCFPIFGKLRRILSSKKNRKTALT